MLNTRGLGKVTLTHQLPINENPFLKVLHLVLQVDWKGLKLQWMWQKSHVSSATNLNIVTKRYCISEVNIAKTLLKVANFNKDSVHTQCIFFKNVRDKFEANLMYHSNGLNKYFKMFPCDADSMMAFEIGDDKDCLGDTFKELIASKDINKHGYVLSDIEDFVNEKLKEIETGGMFSFLFCLTITFHKHSIFK